MRRLVPAAAMVGVMASAIGPPTASAQGEALSLSCTEGSSVSCNAVLVPPPLPADSPRHSDAVRFVIYERAFDKRSVRIDGFCSETSCELVSDVDAQDDSAGSSPWKARLRGRSQVVIAVPDAAGSYWPVYQDSINVKWMGSGAGTQGISLGADVLLSPSAVHIRPGLRIKVEPRCLRPGSSQPGTAC